MNATTSKDYGDVVVQVFTDCDCDHLSAALAERYHLKRVYIGFENGAWIHSLVEHPEAGLYLDVNGVQTFEEVQANWEHCEDWDGIYPHPETDRPEERDRHRPEIPVSAGIALVTQAAADFGLLLRRR
ncbi:hypothetical protein [Dietzia sp. 179-F 9C3 NHS]|uniref:hypothetical protein n=1 Tax=Dietzia sp. 179-F 9C3 NHS TaxID=3374295 RepID=UPI003878FD02